MKKLKPNDHVRGTAGHDHMFTGPDLLDAVVLETNELTNEVIIQIVKHQLYPHDEGAILNEDEKNLELTEEEGD